jgi:phage tail-like protein
MAEREIPYSQFNFLVDLGDGTDDPKAGFQEVSGLGFEVNVAEYRRGNSKENSPQKVPGTYKVSDVTLKRGVIGAEDLFAWLKQVREANEEFRRNITITLLAEDRETTAATWKITNAFPTKYTGPSLNGKGTDVAIEELVLAGERVDMEV